MLGENNVYATIPAKDLDEARQFYERVLGLEKSDENPGGVYYRSGDTKIFVYASDNAGSNQATSAVWEVDDVYEVVKALKDLNVEFEHYDDLPGTTREEDVHTMGDTRAAWFKDPSGNILCVSG
jgi:catechol 2,3-dioxygenase-like lactoylglutathione lyase family enzyme